MKFFVADTFWKRLRGITGYKNTCIFFPRATCLHGFSILHPVQIFWVDSFGEILKKDLLNCGEIKTYKEAFGAIEVRGKLDHDKNSIKFFQEFFQDKNGQVTLELALILPLFLMLVFGFFELGFYILEKQKITHSVHYAAEVGGLTNNDLKINGAIIEFCTDCRVTIKSFSKLSTSEIPSGSRRYADLLKIQVEKDWSLSIPFLPIPSQIIRAESATRVLCLEDNHPYQCD